MPPLAIARVASGLLRHWLQRHFPCFSWTKFVYDFVKISFPYCVPFYARQSYSIGHTVCHGPLRLGSMKWSVSVYWKISRSLQQILSSSTLSAKQFEEVERHFHHHTQALNKTNKSLPWWVNIFCSTGTVTIPAAVVSLCLAIYRALSGHRISFVSWSRA